METPVFLIIAQTISPPSGQNPTNYAVYVVAAVALLSLAGFLGYLFKRDVADRESRSKQDEAWAECAINVACVVKDNTVALTENTVAQRETQHVLAEHKEIARRMEQVLINIDETTKPVQK